MSFFSQQEVRVPIRIQHPGEVPVEVAMQLRALVEAQRDMRSQLAAMSDDNPARAQIAEQLVHVNAQIEALTHMLEQPASPGVTVVETSPRFEFPRMPDEYFALGMVLILSTVLPFSVAMAVRFMRRGFRPAAPQDLAERINRIETAVEATALEVERIGEGQRFVTQMMGEHMAALREATRASLVEQGQNRSMSRQVTPH